MRSAEAFLATFDVEPTDGRCLEDRNTIVRYFNFVLKARDLTGRAFIYRDRLTFMAPSLTLEMPFDKSLQGLAPHIKNREDLVSTLEEVEKRFIAQAGRRQGHINDEFDPANVSLALVHRKQMEQMEHDIAADTTKQDRLAYEKPISFRQFGDLYLHPTIDALNVRVPVTEAICAAMDIEVNDLYEIGLENLRTHVKSGDLKVDTFGNGIRSIDSENPPASALFLLPEFWERQERKIGGPPALRLINGDVIMFAPSTDDSAMAALRENWDAGVRAGVFPKPMVDQTFIWSDGTFKVA